MTEIQEAFRLEPNNVIGDQNLGINYTNLNRREQESLVPKTRCSPTNPILKGIMAGQRRREITRDLAVDSAARADSKETAALWQVNAAVLVPQGLRTGYRVLS